MDTIFLLRQLNSFCHFQSKEKPGIQATNSELRRWCERKSVIINGVKANFDDELPDEITSMVLFPKSKSKITLR